MEDSLQYKIEKYLSGAMTPNEVVAFEKLLNENPEIREELLLSEEINDHLLERRKDYDIPDNEYVGRLRSFLKSDENKEIQQTITNIGKEYSVNSSKSRRSGALMIAASIAAIVFVSLGYWIFGGSVSSEELYVQYYASEDLPSIVKRDGDVSILEKGVVAFQDGKYEEAITFFESYKEKGGDLDPSVFLYTGAAYSEMGNIEQSAENFDHIIQSNSLDASKGLWFKALMYLKANEPNKAKTILEKIASAPSYFNYEKAQELLEKLD